MVRIVVGNILGAGFLIRAHNELGIFCQRQAQLPDAAHTQQRSYQGTFVIIRAPAIDQVSVPYQAVRIRIPTISGANHIQMGQNVQPILPVIQISRPHVAFMIFRPESPALCQFHCPLQGQSGAFAKGLPGLCIRAGGFRSDERHQCLHQLILPALHPL